MRRLAPIALALCLTASASSAAVVADNLFNPRGIGIGPAGTLLVAESGSGRILEIRLRGKGAPQVSTLVTLPAEPELSLGPVDVVARGKGTTFVLTSGSPEGGGDPFGKLLRVLPNGRTSLVADIVAYQQIDLDPFDQDGIPEESNPNGLAILDGNRLLVADAANNDLLLVTKQGAIETVARFPATLVPFPDGLPFGPPPGTLVPAESVPTAVAIGPDGAWYVSELRGFPFVPGTSSIWRIEPGTTGVTCPGDGCAVFATGFTSVIDLAFGPDGTLYVLEIAKEGLLAVEVLGAPPIGALWAVRDGEKTEIAPGAFLFPGGVVVTDEGTPCVTTGAVFGAGGGAVTCVPGEATPEEVVVHRPSRRATRSHPLLGLERHRERWER